MGEDHACGPYNISPSLTSAGAAELSGSRGPIAGSAFFPPLFIPRQRVNLPKRRSRGLLHPNDGGRLMPERQHLEGLLRGWQLWANT